MDDIIILEKVWELHRRGVFLHVELGYGRPDMEHAISAERLKLSGIDVITRDKGGRAVALSMAEKHHAEVLRYLNELLEQSDKLFGPAHGPSGHTNEPR